MKPFTIFISILFLILCFEIGMLFATVNNLRQIRIEVLDAKDKNILNKSLNKNVKSFEDEFKLKIDYPIRFVYLIKPYIGYCHVEVKRVELDINFYRDATEEQREILVYHELGHCSLNLAHNENKIKFNDNWMFWPASIMRHNTFNKREIEMYMTHKNYYLNEMRNGKKLDSESCKEDPIFGECIYL